MKTRLIFVRHAEAEGNANRVFHGWTDSSLTPKGHSQGRRVADRLKDEKIDIIYSSSLKRTLQTAEYISQVKGLPIIRTDKLKEINGGDWEDKSWEVLPVKWPEEYRTWEKEPQSHKMPNGETMVDFQQRVLGEVKYIINNNKGKHICVVTHGTAIKALLCAFYTCTLEEMLRIPWHDNTSVTIVDYDDEKEEFHVVMERDTSHLEKEMSTLENQEWWILDKEKVENRKEN